MLRAGMFKGDAVGSARSIATFHEMEDQGNTNGIKPLPNDISYVLFLQWGLGTTNANAMDLSNNSTGRTHIDNEVV